MIFLIKIVIAIGPGLWVGGVLVFLGKLSTLLFDAFYDAIT